MSTRPNTQSELIAKLSGALLNSVSSSYNIKGRVTTVVERKQSKVSKATGNQTMLGTTR